MDVVGEGAFCCYLPLRGLFVVSKLVSKNLDFIYLLLACESEFYLCLQYMFFLLDYDLSKLTASIFFSQYVTTAV